MYTPASCLHGVSGKCMRLLIPLLFHGLTQLLSSSFSSSFLYETNALAGLESLCDVNLIVVNALEDRSEKDDLRATILCH